MTIFSIMYVQVHLFKRSRNGVKQFRKQFCHCSKPVLGILVRIATRLHWATCNYSICIRSTKIDTITVALSYVGVGHSNMLRDET